MSGGTAGAADATGVFDEDQERKLAYGGAIGAVIGSLLPWASVLGVTVLGIDGDGIFTLLAGIAVAASLYFVGWTDRVTIGTGIAGVIVVLVPLTTLSSVSSFGVYVTMLAGIALIAAGQSGYRRSS